MISFKLFVEQCWKGYKVLPDKKLKKKNGKWVPNCVPKKGK